MLTAARAWVGPPHIGCHGALGGGDHLPGDHRRFLGEESGDAPKSLHHRKLVVPRLGLEGTAAAPAPPPKAICGEGLGGEAGMWIRYSRKRKKQERRSPKAEEEDGSGSGVTEVKAGEGEQIGSAMDSSPRGMVCSDCGTSRTPLLRQGPAGPKSLCNACGIRYRKAKRAGGPFPDASAPAPAAAGGDRQRRDSRARPKLSVSSKLAAPAARAEEAGKRGEQRPRQRRDRRQQRPRQRQDRRQEELLRLLEESRKFEPSCGKEAVEAAVLLMAMSSGLFLPSC